MDNFISTETVIVLVLFGKKIPRLLRAIIKYSAPFPQRKLEVAEMPILSGSQIQLARRHYSSVVLHGLSCFSSVYTAILGIKRKVEQFKIQREAISELCGNATNQGKKANSDNRIDTLKRNTEALDQRERELEVIRNRLMELFKEIDEIVFEHDLAWEKHCQICINLLFKQLSERYHIFLTKEELHGLEDNNFDSLQEKKAKLKKLGIKLGKKDTDFSVLVRDALVQSLGRMLRKINDEEAIFRSLEVIKEEDEGARKLDSDVRVKYDRLIDTLEDFLKDINK